VGRIIVKKIRYVREKKKKKGVDNGWMRLLCPKGCLKKEDDGDEDDIMAELSRPDKVREKSLLMWEKLRKKLPKIIALGKLDQLYAEKHAARQAAGT